MSAILFAMGWMTFSHTHVNAGASQFRIAYTIPSNARCTTLNATRTPNAIPSNAGPTTFRHSHMTTGATTFVMMLQKPWRAGWMNPVHARDTAPPMPSNAGCAVPVQNDMTAGTRVPVMYPPRADSAGRMRFSHTSPTTCPNRSHTPVTNSRNPSCFWYSRATPATMPPITASTGCAMTAALRKPKA